MWSDETTELLGHDKPYIWRKKVEALKPQSTIPTVKYGGNSIMLWGCFTAGGTDALHKIDDIMRKENYVDILKQHLKTSARKLKLGPKWLFQMINDPSIPPNYLQSGLNTTKSRYWSDLNHKGLISI